MQTHNDIITLLENRAQGLGIAEGNFISTTAKDNITLSQPRLEYAFSNVTSTRNVRNLGVFLEKELAETGDETGDENTVSVRKRELYQCSVTLNLVLFCEDSSFRSTFVEEFVATLPKGFDDSKGNFVKITVQSFEMLDEAKKRVGASTISIDKSVDAEISLIFEYRITEEIRVGVVSSVNFQQISSNDLV